MSERDKLELPADSQELGAMLASLRQRAGLSQTGVAKRMVEAGQTHWRQTTVSRIERGAQPITVPEVGALLNVLGFEGAWSFGDHAGAIATTITLSGTVAATSSTSGAVTVEPGTVRRLREVEQSLLRAVDTIHELRRMHGDPLAPEGEDNGVDS